MTANFKIDLAEILESKLQFGFSVPVSIDVDQLIEYGDDDWVHDLDLDDLLAEEQAAAVIIRAGDIKGRYPHLTDDQAWEMTERLRDDLTLFLEDAVDDAVHINYPSARMRLHTRLVNLRHALQESENATSRRFGDELGGLLRLFNRLPEVAEGDLGLIATALDEIEAASKQDDNSTPEPKGIES